MTQLRPLRPEEVLRALGRAGFEKIRQGRSYVRLRHPDGRVLRSQRIRVGRSGVVCCGRSSAMRNSPWMSFLSFCSET